jgi:hypothetical protein
MEEEIEDMGERKSIKKGTATTTALPKPYDSPAFDDVESQFKDQLLSFTTDIILSDIDILKNIAERGNKMVFHVGQLKRLIAILYLS